MAEYLWALFRCVSTRVLGPSLICLFYGLALLFIFTYVKFLFARATEDDIILKVVHCMIVVWLLPNIVFNYYKAITTSPGTTKLLSDITNKDLPSKKWCTVCQEIKPPRTHHCRSCGKCVLKMDHHCPWINNCVGHFNHQYFELFVSYTFLGVTYFNCLMFSPFIDTVYDTDVNEHRTLLIAVGATSFTCGIALLAFAAWNFYLVSSAQTTIEVAINASDGIELHPYDFGRSQNIRSFFGERTWMGTAYSILIPKTRVPSGDGVSWKIRSECVSMMEDEGYEDMV